MINENILLGSQIEDTHSNCEHPLSHLILLLQSTIVSFISYFSPSSTYYSYAFNLKVENHTLTDTTHQSNRLKSCRQRMVVKALLFARHQLSR